MFSSMGHLSTNRLPIRSIAAIAVFLFLLIFLLPHDTKAYIPASLVCDDHEPSSRSETIPNHVHFVYILSDLEGDFTFQFSHALSIYAAWFYWRPKTIYLHTNAAANGTSVLRAREGQAGKWNKLIFTLFDVVINTVDVPTHAGNGIKIQGMEHKSDFVRVKAVHEFGGVYIDWDVHVLRDIRILRESGFKAIAGRELGGMINSGCFMSEKGGKMIGLWMDGMHRAYTGGWTTHSNRVITSFGQRLIREPGEMLIMERDAFAPGSWENNDTDKLFSPHNETSNIANFTRGDALPSHEEGFSDRFDHPERFPEWAHDWSSTYVLHAFSPDRWQHKVEGFGHVTPRYVLERRSNFARAVYPIARHMYEKGLIDLEDSHLGN
ncbi:hypothetical protein ACHAQA_004063 [Verticillium albo-atrum]